MGLRTSSSISSSLCHLFYISSQAFGCQLRTRLSLLNSSGWILCWHLWGGVCSGLKTQFHWSPSQLNFLLRLVPVTPNSAASHDSFPFLCSESESLRRINCPFLLQKFLCYYIFLIGWFCTMLEICLLSQQKNFDTEACKKRRISSWHCATLLYQPVRYRKNVLPAEWTSQCHRPYVSFSEVPSKESPIAGVSNSTAYPFRAAAESDCRAGSHQGQTDKRLVIEIAFRERFLSHINWNYLAKGPLVHHHHISSRMLAGGQTDLDSQYAWALINLTSLLLVRLHTSVTEQEFSPTPHLVMKV